MSSVLDLSSTNSRFDGTVLNRMSSVFDLISSILHSTSPASSSLIGAVISRSLAGNATTAIIASRALAVLSAGCLRHASNDRRLAGADAASLADNRHERVSVVPNEHVVPSP